MVREELEEMVREELEEMAAAAVAEEEQESAVVCIFKKMKHTKEKKGLRKVSGDNHSRSTG